MSIELDLQHYACEVGGMLVEHLGAHPEGSLRQIIDRQVTFGVSSDWGFSVEVIVRGSKAPTHSRWTAISGNGKTVALAVEDLRSKLDSWAIVLNPTPRRRRKKAA